MSSAPTPAAPPRTMGEVLRRLGNIDPDRIRFQPPPGTATIADVEPNKLCELVDGVLVEKPMGWKESFLAAFLIRVLGNFNAERKLGVVCGPDSTQQIALNLVRIPDVSFFLWDRLPDRKLPQEPVPLLVPDLAAEVLSRSNTSAEMRRKREEYFRAGVRLVWLIDPATRTVEVYTSPSDCVTLNDEDELTGGDVLPGFKLAVRELFGQLDQQG